MGCFAAVVFGKSCVAGAFDDPFFTEADVIVWGLIGKRDVES